MDNFRIENCANSVESALKAEEGGAYRVELCAGIPEGGTTPSYGDIVMARKLLKSTKLNVIIRPRGGDFYYSPLELDIMINDIRIAKEIGADGVVFGCLTSDGEVDMEAMRRLMSEVGNMSVTFHRAFDMCKDPDKALEDIISLKIDRILTSGQEENAVKGIPLLKELVRKANGRIIIMPGCGVNSSNVATIAKETGAKEFHFSGRTKVNSGMVYRNPKVSMGGVVQIDEYSLEITDPQKIQAAIRELRNNL